MVKKNFLLMIGMVCCMPIFAQNELKEGDKMAAEGNYSGAAMMYRQCMDKDEQCLLKIIRMLYDNKIRPQFSDELFQLALPFAQAGDAETQFYLGMMYKQGKGGVSQNMAEAARWFQKSADQGYFYAQSELVKMPPIENDDAAVSKKPEKTEKKAVNKPEKISNNNETKIIPPRKLYIIGGASIAAGIAATLLFSKSYPPEYVNTVRIDVKEYNLIFAAAGLIAGGVCIGIGLKNQKKEQALLQGMTSGYNHSGNNGSRLDFVAAGNGVGLRLTF